jgi:uncharacterized protein (DUF1330 family)
MSKGYVVFTEKIGDPDALAAYSAAAVPTVIAAGGTAIIAGPRHVVAEGDWHGDVTVILEFDSLAAANAWYTGPDYQAIIGQRRQAATSNVALFEAFTP